MIANFLKSSELSKVDLAPTFSGLKQAIDSGENLTSDQIVSRLFKEAEDRDENYPDIFMSLFRALAGDLIENSDQLYLLLILACKSDLDQKIEYFASLLCN